MRESFSREQREERMARRAVRAAERRNWTIRAYPLGEEPGENLSASTTLEQRVAMVWPLTLDAWASSGQEIEKLPRDEWPVRILHPDWMPSNQEKDS